MTAVRNEISADDQGSAFLQSLLPLSTCLLAALIDLLPIPNASHEAVAPSFILCAVFFWTLHRPDLFGSPVCFGCGIFVDMAGGAPLGMTALVLLALRLMLITPKRFLMARSFVVVWFYFALLAALVEGLKWLLASLWYERLLPVEPIALEWLLTLAVYPLVTTILSWLHHAFLKNDDLSAG